MEETGSTSAICKSLTKTKFLSLEFWERKNVRDQRGSFTFEIDTHDKRNVDKNSSLELQTTKRDILRRRPSWTPKDKKKGSHVFRVESRGLHNPPTFDPS